MSDGTVILNSEWADSFREKLDRNYSWPALYIYKFIVPRGKEEDVRRLFPLHTTSEKESRNGNYVSLTFQMMMPSSIAVVEVYRKASVIEGLIAL